jgi:hypothetical protein
MGKGVSAQARGASGLNKIAFIASRSANRGLWQPKGWAGRGGNSGAISNHSSSGIVPLGALGVLAVKKTLQYARRLLR